MKKVEKYKIWFINIVCILALVTVVFPLLLIAKYNYPSADDWSYGAYGYKVLMNEKGGAIGVISAILEAVKYNYVHWEGRFSNAFLACLQPGLWGEQYYGVVAWLMIGSIIFSMSFLYRSLMKDVIGCSDKWLVIPGVVPVIILQILYSPSPAESFYWYTGSVNYTFVYSLSLIFLALFIKLGFTNISRWKYIVLALVSVLLAILIGGNNFATSLSCFLSILLLSALFLWRNRRAFYRTWFLTLIMGISLMLCIFAPGNSARINGNFGGRTNGALQAVWMSLVRSFTNIYSWTNIKVFFMLLFILPFVWIAVKNAKYQFRFPGVFTLITFGLYASQATATMYIDGTTGGGRMAAILFYSYLLWISGNVSYWIGWLGKKQNKVRFCFEKFCSKCERYILVYCAIIGIVLVGTIYRLDLHDLTSYKAYRNWKQGWAQQYAAEWEARLEILHDENIKEVVFEPLSVNPEMLMYTDLQDENGYIWVNDACAQYYGKESIRILGSAE